MTSFGDGEAHTFTDRDGRVSLRLVAALLGGDVVEEAEAFAFALDGLGAAAQEVAELDLSADLVGAAIGYRSTG
jgi:hypothetical protein